MKIRCLILIILFSLSTVFAAYSYAGDVRSASGLIAKAGGKNKKQSDYKGDVSVVSGLIEGVSGSSIKINGIYYNISEAQLLNPSGKGVSTSELIEGKKVEIYFSNNNITSVIIHEYMVE